MSRTPQHPLPIASLQALIAATAIMLLASAFPAMAEVQCGASVVKAPDGTSLTVLFDDLVVSTSTPNRACVVSAPLNLPAGYSIGVYRIDYRGYAHLAKKASATLSVNYALGPKSNGRQFKRSVRGMTDDDFLFTETIGAGQMKRVGCGNAAQLDVRIDLSVVGGPEALAALDSSDGAAKHGIVFQLDLKKC